jgi:hypothetical protein
MFTRPDQIGERRRARLMNKMPGDSLSIDTPATYCIRFQGLLNPSWAFEFGHMRIEHTRNAGEPPVTTMTGRVVDQAALAGILNLVYDLGYPLLSVKYLGKAE